jgi:hypothetical protein
MSAPTRGCCTSCQLDRAPHSSTGTLPLLRPERSSCGLARSMSIPTRHPRRRSRALCPASPRASHAHVGNPACYRSHPALQRGAGRTAGHPPALRGPFLPIFHPSPDNADRERSVSTCSRRVDRRLVAATASGHLLSSVRVGLLKHLPGASLADRGPAAAGGAVRRNGLPKREALHELRWLEDGLDALFIDVVGTVRAIESATRYGASWTIRVRL